MRDQLSQVEERPRRRRDLQLSRSRSRSSEPEEVGELRRQLSAERHRRERLLKESNERLRKAHQVMSRCARRSRRWVCFKAMKAADAADEAAAAPSRS